MDFRSLYEKTKNLSVLLVEDHAPSRQEMQEILQDLFADVVSVSDGEEALRTYRIAYHAHRPFDLVITDIKMPHMDGVFLAQTIKKMHKKQAIIVLSAYPESQYLLELINIGLSKFITKPIDHEKFFQVISDVTQTILEMKTPATHTENSLLHIKQDLVWDIQKRLLKYQNHTIDLSKNELLFMECLAANGEKITTTQSLLETFYYSGIDINENGIRNLVLRLRKKLPDNVIHTVYGMGYKLII
jgi:DNA-binding response OmpR family regulator